MPATEPGLPTAHRRQPDHARLVFHQTLPAPRTVRRTNAPPIRNLKANRPGKA
jgi:hypothetical protein